MRRLIAEIGSANGSLAYALEAVDEFAKAGAWAIKAQLFRADTLVTRDARPYGTDLQEPATQHEAFSQALSYDDWAVVASRCRDVGVVFFGSVFDADAVDAGIDQLWPAVKIASADITNRPLLEKVAAQDWHIFLSTGASTETEIRRAVGLFHGVNYTLMACTLAYPCPLVEAHVNRMHTLKYEAPHVGYSDHTRGIAAADYAYRIGASVVEKHVTLTPGAGGDHDFGITPVEVNHLIVGDVWTNDAVDALVAGSDELFVRGVEQKARRLARRSPHALVDIPAGAEVNDGNTIMLRPADGIDPFDLPITAEIDVRAGQVIHR